MKKLIQLIAMFICFTIGNASLHAAVKYWDINGATAGAGGATPSGTWGVTTPANWNTVAGGTGAAANWANGDTAVFSAGTDATGSYTITMGGNAQCQAITFDEGTVTGYGYSLAIGGAITVNAALATWNGNIVSYSGNPAMSKAGTGTFVIGTNANKFLDGAGTTFTIANGAVSIADVTSPNHAVLGLSSALGRTKTLVMGNGTTTGTLRYTGPNGTMGTNTTTGPTAITLGSGTGGGVIDVTTATTALTIATALGGGGGGGALTKIGSGTLNLTAANTFTGTATITAGTLTLGHATDTLDAAITVSGGTLNVNNPDTVGAVTLTSGTISGDSTLIGTSYTVESGTVSTALGGAVAMTKNNTGTVTLSGNNTFTGGVTINQGEVILGNAGALNSTTPNSVTFGNNANTKTLTLNGNSVTVSDLATGATVGTTTVRNNHASTAATLTVNKTSGSSTYGGVLADGAAADLHFFKTGAGTVTLSGNNTFTGKTKSVGGGVLVIDSETRLGTTGGQVDAIQLGGGGALRTTATFSIDDASRGITLLNTAGGGAGAGIFDTDTGTALTVANIIAGQSGDNGLTKTGTGTLILSAVNTYSGLTTVSAGVLVLGHASDTLDNAITVSGGTLNVDNNDTVGAVTLTSGTISGDSTLTGSSYAMESGTVSAVLGGAVTLTKSTAGNVTLSGANTYSGLTTISAGVLILGHASDTVDGDITVSGGTLNVDNPDTVGVVTLTSGTISGDSGLTGSSYDVRSGTVSGILAGSGALTKTTTGTVIVSGGSANTYNGLTTVSAGVLRLGKTSGLDAFGGDLTINGGTVDYNGVDNQIPNSADVTLSSGTLDIGTRGETIGDFGGGNGSFTMSGGSLLKGGATGGDLVLDRNPSISGGTVTLSAGTAAISVMRELAFDGGTIDFTSTGGGGARLILMGGTGTGITYSSGTTTATISSSGGGTANGVTLNDGGTTVFTIAETTADPEMLISAKIHGVADALEKAGAGKLVLSGDNAYTGDTTVSGGTLLINGSLAAGSAVTVASTATLGGTGTINDNITVHSGGTLAPGTSIGTLTANGDLTLENGSTTEVEVNRSGPSADLVTGIDTLTQDGTLEVSNLGATLQVNDQFTLFSATIYSGEFDAISPANPNSDTELAWDTPALKNTGVLKVHHVPYATNVTVFRGKGLNTKVKLSDLFPATDPVDSDAVVLNSFTAGGQGATITSNAAYIFYVPANDNNDTFDYTVKDDRGGSRTRTITVTVTNGIGSVTVTNGGGGELIMSFYGIPDYQYVLQKSCLDLASWADVETKTAPNTPPNIGLLLFTNTPGCSPAFYRIRQN